MAITEINQDNAWDYAGIIGDDMADNMSRYYFRGLLILDVSGDLCAGIIWELENLESSEPTFSRIKWFKAVDAENAGELFEAYKQRIEQDEVKKSFFVIPVDIGGVEKKILKDNGFSVRLTEGDDIVVSLEELTRIPIIRKTNPMRNIEPLNSMTIRQFRSIMAKCVAIGKKGVCEDLQYLSMTFFEPDVSCFVQGEKDVTGIMLFHKKPSGIISIALMVAFDKDFSKTIPGMMRFFVDKMQEKYSLETKVHFNRHNEISFLLSEKLLPRGFGTPVYTGEREES